MVIKPFTVEDQIRFVDSDGSECSINTEGVANMGSTAKVASTGSLEGLNDAQVTAKSDAAAVKFAIALG